MYAVVCLCSQCRNWFTWTDGRASHIILLFTSQDRYIHKRWLLYIVCLINFLMESMHHIYAYRLFRRLGRFGCVFLLLSLAGCFGTWCIWRASVFAFPLLVVTPNCSKKGVDFGMCCSRIGFNNQGSYQFVELQIRHSLFIFFWKIYFNIVETKMLCNCFSLWLFFLKKMPY